jgi:hypothetical protein
MCTHLTTFFACGHQGITIIRHNRTVFDPSSCAGLEETVVSREEGCGDCDWEEED